MFVVNSWLYSYDIIWYSFSVFFAFGIELETQLSHYETHCSKSFLLKSLLTRKTRCSYTARWFEQAVKIPFSINTTPVSTIVSCSLEHFSSSKGRNKAHSVDFERLLQSKHPCLLCCSEREAHQWWRHKIQFRQYEPFRLYGEEKGPFSTSNISATFQWNHVKLWIVIISIIIFYFESKSNQAQFRCIWPLNLFMLILVVNIDFAFFCWPKFEIGLMKFPDCQ